MAYLNLVRFVLKQVFLYNHRFQEVDLSEENFSIIVRMPNWLGDIVMATPVLEDLRKAFPKAEITAMCRRPGCAILEEDPHIDELFCFDKCGAFARREERRNCVQKLVKGGYDIGILLTNSFSSAWLFWQGKVAERIGYSDHFRRLFLSKSLRSKGKEQHQVITYKELLQPLGIPLSNTKTQLYVKQSEMEQAREVLQSYRIPPDAVILGVNPGASYGSAKCWLPSRFELVAKRLLEEDPSLYILFFGDSATSPLIKEICSNLPSRAINLAGLTSIRELMAMISLCHGFLTNDSGPMHIASAFGIPLVALFGSTDELVTGPYNGGKVIRKNVECSPCFQRTCPLDFRCMKGIHVNEVYEEVKKALSHRKNHEKMDKSISSESFG